MSYKIGTPEYEKWKKKRISSVRTWRQNNKKKMIAACGGKCQCCGYDKSHWALEFHHIDANSKTFGISTVTRNPKAAKFIAEELKKCILLCSNCHREIEHGIRQLPEIWDQFNEEIFFSVPPKSIKKKIPRLLKINLSDDEFLLRLSILKNNSALARELKVSEAAIRKRKTRILGP